MAGHILLCGLGRVGERVLAALQAAGHTVTVVDLHTNPDDPIVNGAKVIKGDCRQLLNLKAAGVESAAGVLIVTSEDLINIATAFAVRKLNPHVRIVVRMFNQALIPRLGSVMTNTVALSVSALIAPLLAVMALTGETAGVFQTAAGPRQLAELPANSDTGLAGFTVGEIPTRFKLTVVALTPEQGHPHFWDTLPTTQIIQSTDRVTLLGHPDDLAKPLQAGSGELFPGVRWAGWLRRQLRTLKKTLASVDTSVKIATAVLLLTLTTSTCVFRFALNTTWAEGFYQTISLTTTSSDLQGENKSQWAKTFLSVVKLLGTALIAAFTAIFTQYLIRAKLGGALETRKIPDSGHVVVCGLGNVGFRVVETLHRLGIPVVALDRVSDNPFTATVRRMGIAAIVGDATVPEVLRQARVDTARAVIAATSNELANLEIALLVREANPKQRIVVRLTDPSFAQSVREASAVRLAVSVPALAAPAFVAALTGDRVHTLLQIAGRTFAVVDWVVPKNGSTLAELAKGIPLFPVLPLNKTMAKAIPGETVTVLIEVEKLGQLPHGNTA